MVRRGFLGKESRQDLIELAHRHFITVRGNETVLTTIAAMSERRAEVAIVLAEEIAAGPPSVLGVITSEQLADAIAESAHIYAA
ncbi:MAG: hypothetical protein M0002_18610 [Rhodospirillales bacterium]|nr:hypothetical protein [Rhodospirillales bacterium]